MTQRILRILGRSSLTLLAAAGLLALPSATLAANLDVQGGVTADFFTFTGPGTRTLNFDQGNSSIFDNGDLHIATDDFLYLQANDASFSNRVDVTGDLYAHYPIYAMGNQIKFGGGSSITDNGTGTLTTMTSNGNFYLKAPVTSVSNSLNVNGVI